MRQARSFISQFMTTNSEHRSTLYSLVSCLFVLLLATSMGWAAEPQAAPKAKTDKAISSQPDWSELDKYPGLLDEYGRLITRFQHEIKLPPVRSQSQLLRIMPQSTTAYGAFPNYGAAAHQALEIFHEELKSSVPLRDWWQHEQASSKGPNLETMLGRYSQLSDYLGDEVVASGTFKENAGGLLLIAEVKKPGLETFLRGAVKELAGKSTPPQVLNLKELATATAAKDQPVILVRPDLVVFSSDLKALRSFNAKLVSEPKLDTTAFGKRLSESYQRGVEMLLAADLHAIIKQVPKGSGAGQQLFQRTGFADAKYAIVEYANLTGQAPSQAELSFTGPRTGIASWLAAPSHLDGLNFVSPDAAMVMSVLLKNPADIFADIKAFADTPQDAQKLAGIEPILLPILGQLTGEVTLELDAFPPSQVEWKMILGSRDVNALQQMLAPFLSSLQPRKIVEGGETYYQLQIPNGRKPMEISYSLQPGYLVIGSSQPTVAKAVLARRSGESLGRSEKFLAALPPGRSTDASGIWYQNTAGFLKSMATNLPPELMSAWLQASEQNMSVVSAVYGEETVIRQASKSGAAGVTPVLIGAAIAIPNLLRSRIAANEASAVGSVRTLNTAQVMYANTYPQRGYARDLATLGISPKPTAPSPVHAQLINPELGCATGTVGGWCTKSGFKFTIRTTCTEKCGQFVVIATPESTSTGTRNFCSTADGVIRYKVAPPLATTISATECLSWKILQ